MKQRNYQLLSVSVFVTEELRDLFEGVGLVEEQNLVDRRLLVNRGRQLTMYRVWIQCKYRRPLWNRIRPNWYLGVLLNKSLFRPQRLRIVQSFPWVCIISAVLGETFVVTVAFGGKVSRRFHLCRFSGSAHACAPTLVWAGNLLFAKDEHKIQSCRKNKIQMEVSFLIYFLFNHLLFFCKNMNHDSRILVVSFSRVSFSRVSFSSVF